MLLLVLQRKIIKRLYSRFFKALKRDIGIDSFGVIRVGRFTNDCRDDEIICAQNEICAENKDFLMLTDIAVDLNKQCDCMNPNFQGHYSAKGLERLGCAAAKTLSVFNK